MSGQPKDTRAAWASNLTPGALYLLPRYTGRQLCMLVSYYGNYARVLLWSEHGRAWRKRPARVEIASLERVDLSSGKWGDVAERALAAKEGRK